MLHTRYIILVLVRDYDTGLTLLAKRSVDISTPELQIRSNLWWGVYNELAVGLRFIPLCKILGYASRP